jgi:sialate O-acetylesterase
MAVIIDIGEERDIHPRNKLDVGRRLAFNALAQIHTLDVPCFGPRYRSQKMTGSSLQIEFDYAEGLKNKGSEVRGFAVAGADRIFHAATAKIDGTNVILSNPKVSAPVAARYGWADCPSCTLYNAAGLPAEPFRTDSWPVGNPIAK